MIKKEMGIDKFRFYDLRKAMLRKYLIMGLPLREKIKKMYPIEENGPKTLRGAERNFRILFVIKKGIATQTCYNVLENNKQNEECCRCL